MTTYNSYEEAKIAMPEACIVKYKHDGKYRFTGMPARESTTLFNGSEFAEPADHCMTVEEFLKAGHKFVEGDIALSHLVNKVCSVYSLNLKDWNSRDADDDQRYILRAAALEKPKRFKVEYLKLENPSIHELAKYYDSGDLFFYQGGEYLEITQIRQVYFHAHNLSIYRRIETEITERDEFIEAMTIHSNKFSKGRDLDAVDADYFGYLFDSGKFKLVEGGYEKEKSLIKGSLNW